MGPGLEPCVFRLPGLSECDLLAQHWDDQMSYGGKKVFHAGDEIRRATMAITTRPGREWVSPNIFAPFKAEHELGLECGSLWDEWVEGMRRQIAVLTERHPGASGLELKQAVQSGEKK